ncbi:hypothetical protein [Shewanella surugensis]|nr:hypothetical protein [Shewanella surugensis]
MMLERSATQTSYASPLLDITGSSRTIAALPEPDSVSQVAP